MPNNMPEKKVSFSLHEVAKPRFSERQISINVSAHRSGSGLPKAQKKITVGRSGKIGYSK